MKSIRFTASHQDDYLHAQLIEMREAINQGHDVIYLDIAGSLSSPPSFILSIYGILQTRPSTTKLIASANSPLVGCDTLLWLAGDGRILAPNAYIYVPVFDLKRSEADQELDWASSGGNSVTALSVANRKFQAAGAELFLRDFGKIAQEMNKYLPVKEYQGQTLDVASLRDLHLLGGEMERLIENIGDGEQIEPIINFNR